MTKTRSRRKMSLWAVAGLTLLLLVAYGCFFAARWFVTVYGRTGFDSILFPLQSSLSGVQSDLIRSYLLGGALVDHVFEPLMARTDSRLLIGLFGTGKGSGAAMLYLLIGFSGVAVCLVFRNIRHIHRRYGIRVIRHQCIIIGTEKEHLFIRSILHTEVPVVPVIGLRSMINELQGKLFLCRNCKIL